MRIEWLQYIRVLTLVANIAFMLLLPFAVHIRVDMMGRTWILIGAIEVAWFGDCVQILHRLITDAPWSWFVSPVFTVSSVLGLIYVLRAGHQ